MSATSDPPPLPPAAPAFPGWPGWPDPAALQWVKDNEHLRMLSLFHYILGGLAILFSSLFIFHIVFGIMMLSNPRLFEAVSAPLESPALSTPAASPDETASAAPPPTPHPVHRPHRSPGTPPAFFGYFMAGMGSLAVLFGWTVGALLIYSARCLARRTRRTFSLVVAGISCLQVPFGTILGVFTIVVLQRPSVQALYAAGGQR